MWNRSNTPPRGVTASTGVSIVIIDDSQIVLDVMSEVLGGAGYDVTPLWSPKEYEVTETIMQKSPALVLVDIEMPEARGDNLIAVMRGYGFLSTAKVLLFSDRSEIELALLSETCGADGFIRKTADRPQLLAQIARHLGGSHVSAP